jgi:hypothetical protein
MHSFTVLWGVIKNHVGTSSVDFVNMNDEIFGFIKAEEFFFSKLAATCFWKRDA